MEGDIQISVRKTTVRKFQKAAISNDKIAAITGQSEQTLQDYATTDMEDHQKIKILSSKKSDVVAVQPARVFAAPQPTVSRTSFIHQSVSPSVCF